MAGAGFRPGERVTVRVIPVGAAAFSKTVVAASSGRFTARFRLHSVDKCVGYRLTAVGSDGSRAIGHELVPPPCGIAPQP